MGSLVSPLGPCYLVPRRQGEKHVMARKPTDEVQLKLRFDEKLRRRLARAAERKDRSMNAEIVLRLESSFQQEDTEQLFERALAAIVEDVQDIKQMMKEMTGPPRAGLILEAIDRTLKVLGISADPRTWSPEMRAWAAQQPGLLGLSSEQPATDKKEDLK
jgi:hypothetical protein